MARKKAEMTGERHGDFLVCRKVAERTYEVKCLKCGDERAYSVNSIRYGKMKCDCSTEEEERESEVCAECGEVFWKVRSAQRFCSRQCCSLYHNRKKKHAAADENRKITKTTRMLVCVYAAEGMSAGQTANFLRRPEKTILEILEKCKENGEYKSFVNASPVLKARKRICT